MKQRKDGRWFKTKTINGKRVWFVSTEPTEKKAIRDIERQMIEYSDRQKNGPLFAEVADKCETQHRESLPDVSFQKTYEARYRRVVENFGNKLIKDITPKDIDVFFGKLKKQGFSSESVAMHKVVLNMIFNYAYIELECIPLNFIPGIKNPVKGGKKKRRMANSSDIDIIKNNHDGIGYLAYFIMYEGLRPSEALAIQDTDFDWGNNVIRVNKKVVHHSNKPVVEYQTKTEAGERYVSLLDRIKTSLPEFKGFLFSADGGKTPLTKKQLQYRYDKWRKETGCSCTLYQLRHAYATLLHEAGVNEFDAMKLMGHSSIQVTKDIYTEIRQKQISKATAMLDDADY